MRMAVSVAELEFGTGDGESLGESLGHMDSIAVVLLPVPEIRLAACSFSPTTPKSTSKGDGGLTNGLGAGAIEGNALGAAVSDASSSSSPLGPPESKSAASWFSPTKPKRAAKGDDGLGGRCRSVHPNTAPMFDSSAMQPTTQLLPDLDVFEQHPTKSLLQKL